jgi:hypothetical protein
MAGSAFRAVDNRYWVCPVRTRCPVQDDGQAVTMTTPAHLDAGQPSLFDTSPAGACSPRRSGHRLGESTRRPPSRPGGHRAAAPACRGRRSRVGKTQTMVWLVANGLVEPHRVLGLTFTRKAAAGSANGSAGCSAGCATRTTSPFLSDDVAAGCAPASPP